MPYLPYFFLVFAGMLIGYFLWYRDRSEEEARRQSIDRENEDLRTSLKLAHNSYEKLDERFLRQKGQLNVLQQLCDDWSTSREQIERDRARLEAEIGEKSRRFEEATAELQTEKELRISLEDKQHQLTQESLEKVGQLEDSWRQRHAKIESSLFQRQADLKSTSGEKERLGKALHLAEGRIAELESELASQKSLLETATKNHSGLEQEYVSVESALSENANLLKSSRAECAEALSALNVSNESMAEMEKVHQELNAEIEDLRSKVATMESLESQVVSMQQSLDNGTDQLLKVTMQRDAAIETEKSAMARSKGLEQRIENQENTIHKLRDKHEAALKGVKVEIQRRSDLESEFASKTTDLEARLQTQETELTRQNGDLSNQFEQTVAKLKEQLSAQTETIQRLTAEQDGYESELTKLKSESVHMIQEFESQTLVTQKLSQQCEGRTEALQRVEAERNGLIAQVEQSNADLARLTSQIEELKTTTLRISELETLLRARESEDEQVVNEMRTLREQYAQAYQRQQELQTELKEATTVRESMEAEFGQHGTETRLLKMKLKASEETIRKLRRERAGVLARLANYRTIAEPDATVISFTEAIALRERQLTQYDSEYGGRTSQHEKRGLIYTEAPESRDDLKRISGIAEVLEGRLNDYGIYTFKQVMEWKPEAVEEFSRLLAFKDRIERDEWLNQARFFYEEKLSARADAQRKAVA